MTLKPVELRWLAVLASLSFPSGLKAQDLVSLLGTSNVTGNWSTATANWYVNGDAAKTPVPWTQGRVARMPSATTLNYTLTLTESISAAGLLNGNENNSYAINSTAHVLTLSGNIGPGKFTIAPAVVVATNQTWSPGGSANGHLSLTGPLTLNGNLLFTPRRTSITHRFDGIVSGPGTFTLTTGSALNVPVRFNQPNTFSGGVTVNSGTLLVTNTTGSGTGSGPVVIQGTGTLAGTGLLGGSVTLVGGTLRPGSSATTATTAVLRFGSGLTLENGGSVAMDITGAGDPGTAFDQLAVTGTAQLGGSLEIILASPLTAGNFDLLDFSGRTGHFDQVSVSGAQSVTFTRDGDLWSSAAADGTLFRFSEADGFLSIGPDPATAGESIVFPPYAQSGVINVTTDLTQIILTNKVIRNPAYDPGQPVSGTNPVTILYTGPIHPVNAVGDGVADDTAALKAALDAFPSGNRIIYLPNGIYKVSDRLEWPVALNTDGTKIVGTAYKRTILQGQSRDGAIIRLADNSPGFSNPTAVRAVVWTGNNSSGTGDGAQRFRNAVRNLTIDTGTGNPGAAALQFNASNQGVVADIRLRCPDLVTPSERGLDISFVGDNGPCLFRDILVEGFQVGVQAYGSHTCMLTLENISVSGQKRYGLENQHMVLFIRNYSSTNAVPAINQRDGVGVVTVVGARFQGLPGAEALSAVETLERIYLSDAAQTGYARLVNSGHGTGADIVAGGIAEYETSRISLVGGVPFTTPVTTGFNHPGTTTRDVGRGMLNLPVKDTPRIPWDPDFSRWIDVKTLTPATNGDYTAAINAAIAASPTKSTLFFPRGTYVIRGVVELTNGIRRVVGSEATTTGAGYFRLINNGTNDAVIIERFDNSQSTLDDLGYEQASSRPLVISSVSDLQFVRTQAGSGTGDLFLEDVVPRVVRLNQPGQRTWARQLDTEWNNDINVLNNGAHLWILGYKTEVGNNKITTLNGGYTELFGWNVYRNTGALDNIPGLDVGSETAVANHSHVGIFQRQELREGRQDYYEPLLRETRGALGSGTTNSSSLVAAYPEWTSLALPAAGDPAAPPTASYDTVTLTAEGRGTGPGGIADTCHYRHLTRRLPGDGIFSARLKTLDPGTTAGIMMRADFGAAEAFAALVLNPAGELRLIHRAAPGTAAEAVTVATGIALPCSLRITREGDRFWSYHRAGGNSTWTLAGTGPLRIPMWPQILAGAVVAGNLTASFDAITLGDDMPTYEPALAGEPDSLTYGLWEQLHFTPDERAAASAVRGFDPDRDGLANFLEYAFGANPRDPFSFNRPTMVPLADRHGLRFQKSRLATDLTYTVQISDTLAAWIDGSRYGSSGDLPDTAATTEVSRTPTAEVESITVRENSAVPSAKLFFQLEVVED